MIIYFLTGSDVLMNAGFVIALMTFFIGSLGVTLYTLSEEKNEVRFFYLIIGMGLLTGLLPELMIPFFFVIAIGFIVAIILKSIRLMRS